MWLGWVMNASWDVYHDWSDLDRLERMTRKENVGASKDLEYLLKAFYRKRQENGVVREYGLYPLNLTDESGIHFEDAGDALAAVDRMKKLGWIKILSIHHAGRIGPSDSIQLTEEGIRHTEWLFRPRCLRYLRDAYVATVEGIIRGLTRR